MKKILPLLFFFTACHSGNDNKTGSKNENSKYTVSTDGLDELKIGMKQEELEKLLDQKLVLKNAEANTELWVDTAHVKYKDIDVALYFQRTYPDENSFYMLLTGLQSSNPLCKTNTGLGIGDNKEKIIATYPADFITMGPEYVNDTSSEKSPTKYFIRVKDDNWSRETVFHLDNRKVASLEVSMLFDQED